MEDLKEMREVKSSKAYYVLKDFLYHTAHVLSAMSRQYFMDFGVAEANKIIEKSLKEYKEKFGAEKKEALVEEGKLNFLAI